MVLDEPPFPLGTDDRSDRAECPATLGHSHPTLAEFIEGAIVGAGFAEHAEPQERDSPQCAAVKSVPISRRVKQCRIIFLYPLPIEVR